MTFRKLALVVALSVAMVSSAVALSNTFEASEDDDMVALDFDGFSDELEELGPGDEDLMDAIFYHREMKGNKGNGKNGGNGKTQDEPSGLADAGGDSDSDGANGKNHTKAVKGKKDGPAGLGDGKNSTKTGDSDYDGDADGKNRTKAGKGKKDAPSGLGGGKNSTKGSDSDYDGDADGKNRTNKAGKGKKDDPSGLGGGKNSTKAGKGKKDGPSGLGGDKNSTKGGDSDYDGDADGKNRTKAGKGKKDAPSGLGGGKNSTKAGKGKKDGPSGLGGGKNSTKADKKKDNMGGSKGGKNSTKPDGKKNNKKDGKKNNKAGDKKKNTKKKKAKDITKKDENGMPVWWNQIKTNFTKNGTRLKRCGKRTRAPLNGDICAIKPKTCYFGSQVCPGATDHPTLVCDCKNQKWTCEPEVCASCPAAQPVSGSTCSTNNSTCGYGAAVQCCGESFPTVDCTCSGGVWDCPTSNQCTSPVCATQTWDDAVNKTCAFARKDIKDEYPGMKVKCVSESKGASTVYDINRVQVIVSSKNRVVAAPQVG